MWSLLKKTEKISKMLSLSSHTKVSKGALFVKELSSRAVMLNSGKDGRTQKSKA
jgi:hypothetical protein